MRCKAYLCVRLTESGGTMVASEARITEEPPFRWAAFAGDKWVVWHQEESDTFYAAKREIIRIFSGERVFFAGVAEMIRELG